MVARRRAKGENGFCFDAKQMGSGGMARGDSALVAELGGYFHHSDGGSDLLRRFWRN